MNLATTPFLRAGSDSLSLQQLLAEAETFPSINAAPHERISILRLLIAISHDALGNLSASDLRKLRPSDLATATSDYLAQPEIESAFELLGEGPRFLQVRTDKIKTTPCSKIFLHLATGNNPTLLDHAGGTDRAFSPENLATALLTYQNFSPLIGRGFKGRGPCVSGNALHSFRVGSNLAETILENLLDSEATRKYVEGFGTPIWRMPVTAASLANPETDPAARNATLSYLGRLVPLSRALWISDDRTQFVLDNGLPYPGIEKAQEPTTTVRWKQKKGSPPEPFLLSAKVDRAIWRDLPAILRGGEKGGEATPVLRPRQGEQSTDLSLWCGGLVTDFKAKVIDTVSAEFSGPLALPKELNHEFGVAAYQAALVAAETWEISIGKALYAYCDAMKLDTKKRLPDLKRTAREQFWDRMQAHLPQLLDLVRDPPEASSAEPYTDSPWHRTCKRVAGQVYADCCPSDTPRQAMAHGRGLRALWPKNPAKKTPSKKTVAA